MEIDAFADWAARIARVPTDGSIDRERLSYLGLGLAGEAGEIADLVKKLLRDGDQSWRPERLAEELGDLVVSGHAPSDVLSASRAKIEARIAAAKPAPAPPSE